MCADLINFQQKLPNNICEAQSSTSKCIDTRDTCLFVVPSFFSNIQENRLHHHCSYRGSILYVVFSCTANTPYMEYHGLHINVLMHGVRVFSLYVPQFFPNMRRIYN